MPAVKVLRPRLHTFRVLAFTGENKDDAVGGQMNLTTRNQIEVGLNVPSVSSAPLMAVVKIKLESTGVNVDDANAEANFTGEYEAKFYYATSVTEEVVAPLLDDHDYQYVLVAQAYPLAMMHFRRELQSMGLDARAIPLGVE